mgnify:CR=1 FL=1
MDNLIKVQIDNRDLAYTIDTYGMFTGESVAESESEHYRDEFDLTEDEWSEIGFDYDHAGIVKDLASASVNILWNELKGAIVHEIAIDKTGSPQFYNYTTDHYVATWTIDADVLKQYIEEANADFENFITEFWDYEYSKAVSEDDVDTQTVIALDFWTRRVLSEDSYNEQMWEAESEAYFNNMELDEESDLLVKRKIKEMGAK